MSSHKDHLFYQEGMREMTDEKLVELFNNEVGNPHWVSARGEFLNALHNEFQRRGIDYQCVKNISGGFNLAEGNEVDLVGKRLTFRHNRLTIEQLLQMLGEDLNPQVVPKITSLDTRQNSVTVANYFTDDLDGLLIVALHRSPNTLIVLSGISHAYIFEISDMEYHFRNEMQSIEPLLATSYCNASGPGSYMQVVLSRRMLIIKTNCFAKHHRIRRWLDSRWK